MRRLLTRFLLRQLMTGVSERWTPLPLLSQPSPMQLLRSTMLHRAFFRRVGRVVLLLVAGLASMRLQRMLSQARLSVWLMLPQPLRQDPLLLYLPPKAPLPCPVKSRRRRSLLQEKLQYHL